MDCIFSVVELTEARGAGIRLCLAGKEETVCGKVNFHNGYAQKHLFGRLIFPSWVKQLRAHSGHKLLPAARKRTQRGTARIRRRKARVLPDTKRAPAASRPLPDLVSRPFGGSSAAAPTLSDSPSAGSPGRLGSITD